MAVAGEHLSFSCSVSRQTRRLRNEIPVCPRPGRDRSRRAFRKTHRSAKRAYQSTNRPLLGKSRTTHLGPFGELFRATGPMPTTNAMRFSSQYDDTETDFLYYAYRYYNPSTGRWLSRDPLGKQAFLLNYLKGKSVQETQRLGCDSLQPAYAFVANQPTSEIDRLGLDRWYNISGLHGYVIVEDWSPKCCKQGKIVIEYSPPSIWWEALALTGATVPGYVQINPGPADHWNVYSHHASSTCAEDKLLLKTAKILQLAPPDYQILGKPPAFDCFTFAYLLYQIR